MVTQLNKVKEIYALLSFFKKEKRKKKTIWLVLLHEVEIQYPGGLWKKENESEGAEISLWLMAAPLPLTHM